MAPSAARYDPNATVGGSCLVTGCYSKHCVRASIPVFNYDQPELNVTIAFLASCRRLKRKIFTCRQESNGDHDTLGDEQATQVSTRVFAVVVTMCTD